VLNVDAQIERMTAEIVRKMKTDGIIFMRGTSTPIFAREWNVERQAHIELAFAEEVVPNPEVVKKAISGYVS
jgi:hypothetical protein